jgi:hypothetical protein
MARSINEIFQAILAEKTNQPTLNGLDTSISDEQTLLTELTSNSKVAIWVLWSYLTAIAIGTFEQVMDVFRADIQTILASNVYGTERWWVTKLREFQYGDALTFVNDQPVYDPEDESNRIISAAAAVTAGGQLILKAAKGTPGNYAPLDSSEQAAASEYIAQQVPAGVQWTLISLNADLIRIEGEVFVDPQVISVSGPTAGQLIATPGVYPIEDALEAYYHNLPFNGQFNINHAVNAVQAVRGVNDFVATLAQYRVGANPYVAFNRLYNTASGHIQQPSSGGDTLRDTLTYTAGN